MTDVQRIVSALADCLHDNQISEGECLGVLKALRGIPPEKHMDALKAFLSVEEPELEEQPEDYLQVKTYTSDKFSVGDEVTDGSGNYVILGVEANGFWIARTGVSRYVYNAASSAFHRTGRNFPAIPAIMEDLKKG